MFGGAGLDLRVTDPAAMVETAYAAGVPMGAVMTAGDVAPTFTVYAEKDPDGANLDWIQIIKDWVDSAGDTHERIIDVVWSGTRVADEAGNLPAVGVTVDLTTAL
jgi:hypothetical protein